MNFHWEGLQEDCSHVTALLHIHNVHCRFSLNLELELTVDIFTLVQYVCALFKYLKYKS